MRAIQSALISILAIDFARLARSEDITVGMMEKKFELHFLYLVQTRNDRFTDHNLSSIENYILRGIQQSQNWGEENGNSIITEIDSFPRDSINTNGELIFISMPTYQCFSNVLINFASTGFCVPLDNYANCFVIDGVMTMRALVGDSVHAVARFYNMTERAMNAGIGDGDPRVDGTVYYYTAVEEKNVIIDSDGRGSLLEEKIVFLLVLLSVGVFSLTAAVLYLLCARATRKNQNEAIAAGNGRLGISAVDYLGSSWLEVKSTSSGSSHSSDLDSNFSGKVKFPQIVGNSASSVCCSSVSELSAQTLETTRKGFNANTDLEKIDEEAQSTGDSEAKSVVSEPLASPVKKIAKANDVEENCIAKKDQDTVEQDSLQEHKRLGLVSSPSSTENISFYTPVGTPQTDRSIMIDSKGSNSTSYGRRTV